MRILSSLFLLVALVFSSPADAMTRFSKVAAFGDSVSDNGFQDGAGFMPYTNGYVWVEYLAHSLPGGPVPVKSYAWGGAMTNNANWEKIQWSGLQWQIDQYKKEVGSSDVSDVLYTIYAGGNDFWGGKKDPKKTAQNIVTAMEKLTALGAHHIVIANQYTAVISPGYQRGEYASYREPLTKFKKSINKNLKALVLDSKDSFVKRHPEVNVYYINSDDLFQKIAANKDGYKFQNKTDKWLGTKEYPEAGKYLWWDEWHLMTHAHKLFADFVLTKIEAQK